MKDKEFRKCLVLDSSYMAKQIVDSARAYVIFSKGNAEIIANHREKFSLANPNTIIYRPSIIRIPKYINMNMYKIPYSRDAVFKRDHYCCVYCNYIGYSNRHNLTIDHVIPKSKGGKDSFENCVTACRQCNLEKDDLTLEEWGRPNPNPMRPHWLLMLKGIEVVPEEWMKFLIV